MVYILCVCIAHLGMNQNLSDQGVHQDTHQVLGTGVPPLTMLQPSGTGGNLLYARDCQGRNPGQWMAQKIGCEKPTVAGGCLAINDDLKVRKPIRHGGHVFSNVSQLSATNFKVHGRNASLGPAGGLILPGQSCPTQLVIGTRSIRDKWRYNFLSNTPNSYMDFSLLRLLLLLLLLLLSSLLLRCHRFCTFQHKPWQKPTRFNIKTNRTTSQNTVSQKWNSDIITLGTFHH